ncbi:uncharacterized protein Dvir_GJ26007 [Drosophila virilis]|uniref:Uncharacterized protein n=1 Tax=Drosophila virilis TaxID=7244 RepID=A0A0Q9W6Q9_DROVI|nr:uncharacterized protein Dvir_GJ26007 [Drosophila virilis]
MATTAAAAAAAATAATAATGGVKRVNFDLPSTIDEVAEQEIDNDNDNDSDNSYSLALARPGLNKYSRSSSGSICKPHIVFNGTYPIDMPLGVTPPAPLASHHRSSYDAEANADRSEMQRYRYMMHDYVIDEDAEGEELAEEDDYDDDDGQATTTAAATTTSTTPGVVRTYDIDAPTAGNGNGKGSSAAGLALSTKKQI